MIPSNRSGIALREHPLDAFEDLRHPVGYEAPVGNAKMLVDATLAADHIVFVSPVYWYSVPTPLKLYLDHWSHWDAGRIARIQHKDVGEISCASSQPQRDPQSKHYQ